VDARRVHVALAAVFITISCGGVPGVTPTSPPDPSSPGPAPSKRLLVVTHTAGFRHSSIAVAEVTLANLGAAHNLYLTEFCRNEAEVKARLTPAGLASVDAVFFANTTGDLGIPDMPAFLGWIAAGHGFLGAHSASDTYHESADFIAMLGGEFVAHGAIAEADIKVEDPSDPSVAHLAPRFRITDELYRFTKNSRRDVYALLSMDRVPPDGVGSVGAPADLLMAWRRTYGSGRVFYTALGHGEEVWQDARFQQHLVGALRWALAP
jgi:type 1 glutamine amidotransferase